MHSRREFLKKAAYVAPAVLTLDVALAHASTGSYREPTKPTGTYDSFSKKKYSRHYGWFLGKRVRSRGRFDD